MTDARIVATNPADSSVVPVACNENGELLLAETSMDQFVEKDGDTMTGNLHMGDKIILNPDGSAQFAGGAVDVYDDGKTELSNNATINGNVYINSGAEATGGTTFYNSGQSISSRSTVFGNSRIFLNSVATDRIFGLGIADTLDADPASLKTYLYPNGSASFASTVTSKRLNVRSSDVILAGYQLADSKRVFFVDSSGNTQIGGDLTSTAGSNDPAIFLKPDGSALFTSDVVVGSRNKQWMLVESGGICHLVEQTLFAADVDTADLADDPAAAAGEPSTYPELRNLPQELDQLRSVVTALLTEVQRVEEKLRMAPESGWPVWDGSD